MKDIQEIKQRTKSWWRQNTANIITVAGLITSSWLLFEIIFRPKELARITVLYLLSGITDFLDGKMARWLKVESPLGSIADQFRDKVLFCPSQIILVIQYWKMFQISIFALMAVIGILETITFAGGVIGIFWHIKGFKTIAINSSNWGRKKTFAGFIVGLLIIIYIYPFSFSAGIVKTPALAVAYLGLVLMIYWSLKSLAEYKARVWPNGQNNKAQ
jgi:phosphatidylglycerophosphate synthase